MNRRDFIKAGVGLVSVSGSAAGALTPEPVPAPAAASVRTEPGRAPRFGDARDWWFQNRFGMFIHWGLYSIHGFHEQEQWRLRVPRAEYSQLVRQWNPAHFNPDAWLDLAAAAGMSYVCLTTKHHDGFCLWDTKLTNYNTVQSPFGRDVLRMLSDACRRRKIPLCLYYSVVDWHHPNYPNQGRSHELPPQPGDQPNLDLYLQFLRGQVRELCTEYGEIHGFWWDMNVTGHVDPSIIAMIRQLQPSAVINNRGFDPGDYGTPERDFEKNGDPGLSFTHRTEACQSVGSESWGWRQAEDYYTDRHLLRSIDLYRARDANYLLNVGPKPDGTIDEAPASILRRIGQWHRAVHESFDSAVPASHLTANRDVLLTRQGNTLYVHLCKDPIRGAVALKPLARAPRRAILLNTGDRVEWSLDLVPSDFVDRKGYLRLVNLPVDAFADTVLVVKLEFDGPPEVS